MPNPNIQQHKKFPCQFICFFIHKVVRPHNPIELVWIHWAEHCINKKQKSDKKQSVLPNALTYATTECYFISISMYLLIQEITASRHEDGKHEDI